MRKIEKFATSVNGLKITYYKSGSGAPLLFLHGGRTNALTYERLLLHLSKNYTVIAPDVPGYGQSNTPSVPWSFTEYASCMDDFLEKLALEKVAVMGYSMGGGIAAVLASVSSRVSGLILVDASGIQSAAKKRSRQDFRRFLFYMTHPQYARSFGLLAFAQVQFLWKHRLDYRKIASIQRKCFTTSYEHYLQDIKIPTQLVWGDQDWIYPMEVARTYQKKIPKSKLHTVSGNHDWLVYNPLLIPGHVLSSIQPASKSVR
jgi:pimeloyl-ACP methyl ester carboxylesterase